MATEQKTADINFSRYQKGTHPHHVNKKRRDMRYINITSLQPTCLFFWKITTFCEQFHWLTPTGTESGNRPGPCSKHWLLVGFKIHGTVSVWWAKSGVFVEKSRNKLPLLSPILICFLMFHIVSVIAFLMIVDHLLSSFIVCPKTLKISVLAFWKQVGIIS